MKKALLLVGLLAVVALVLGVTLPTSDQQTATSGAKGEQGERGLTGPAGPRGSEGPRGLQGLTGSVQELQGLLSSLQGLVGSLQNQANQPKLGAVSGPELWSPFWSVDGARTWYYSSKLNATSASTTVCSFKMPNATTTLLHATGQITTASSTALLFEWGKSALAAATTTSLGVLNLASDAKATMLASSTQGDFATKEDLGDPTYVIAPNNYVNLKFGGAATGSSLKGTCKGAFLEN